MYLKGVVLSCRLLYYFNMFKVLLYVVNVNLVIRSNISLNYK